MCRRWVPARHLLLGLLVSPTTAADDTVLLMGGAATLWDYLGVARGDEELEQFLSGATVGAPTRADLHELLRLDLVQARNGRC